MELSLRRLTLSHACACVVGIGAGAALFRLPEWACGPLRWDLLPVWAAATAGFLAAASTVWAVVVAMRGGRDAIAAAHQLRLADSEDRERRRKGQAAVVAAVAVPSIYSLCATFAMMRPMLKDLRFPLSELYTYASNIVISNFDQIEARIDLFTHADAVAFALATAAARGIANNARANVGRMEGWTAKTTESGRADLLSMVISAAEQATVAYEKASALARLTPSVLPAEERGRAMCDERVRQRFG